jgi:uncharacterized RDD family membrane protein YckC
VSDPLLPPPGSGEPPPPGYGNQPPPPAYGNGAPQPYGYQQQGYGYSYGPTGANPAGFWARFGAALLDGLIIGIPTRIVIAAVGGSTAFLQVLSIVVGVLYYGLLEGGATGQTIGKRALGLRVVDATTFQPGVGTGRGIGRYFARWLSGLALGLGYLWMLWDPQKQTWHDKLSNTRVVKVA